LVSCSNFGLTTRLSHSRRERCGRSHPQSIVNLHFRWDNNFLAEDNDFSFSWLPTNIQAPNQLGAQAGRRVEVIWSSAFKQLCSLFHPWSAKKSGPSLAPWRIQTDNLEYMPDQSREDTTSRLTISATVATIAAFATITGNLRDWEWRSWKSTKPA
jgi:hypothetical protein